MMMMNLFDSKLGEASIDYGILFRYMDLGEGAKKQARKLQDAHFQNFDAL